MKNFYTTLLSKASHWVGAAILTLLIFSLAGCTNYGKKGMEEYEKGNYQSAIEDLTKAVEKNPKDDASLDVLAHVYRDFQQAPNNRDFAYKYANQAIQACSPDNKLAIADHYSTLADLYRQDGNYSEAKKLFKKSIDLNPDDYQSQFFYGVSLYATGEYAAGVVHVKRAVKLNPDYQNAKNFLNQIPGYQR